MHHVQTECSVGHDNTEYDEDSYNINLFRIKTATSSVKPKLISRKNNRTDFKVQVVTNNNLDIVVADTGARISVCGTAQARKWNMLHKFSSIKCQVSAI